MCSSAIVYVFEKGVPMPVADLLRKMTQKHQAARAAEIIRGSSSDDGINFPDDLGGMSTPVQETKSVIVPSSKSKAQKAADTRVQNQHGRAREEIDAILREKYRTKGPTLLAKELGMKVTTIMMRARRMGLSADPDLSAQRRVTTRQQSRIGKSDH